MRTVTLPVTSLLLLALLPLVAWIVVFLRNSLIGALAADPHIKTPTDLLQEFGYPSEVHEVVTEDGYILRLDRIPNEGRPVVYMAHALQTSAAAFILLGPQKAIALILFDAGYDVWLANFRGNAYSERHTSLTTSDDKFWNFSWNEHGVYDNPANIDYILRVTGQRNVTYVGHSMGSTSFLVTAAVRPEYQRTIRAAFLMSPASFFKHTRSFVFHALGVPIKMYELLSGTRAQSRGTWYYRSVGKLGSIICPHLKEICSFVIGFICGERPHAYYWEQIPDFFEYIPAGGSTGEIIHYEQLAKEGDPVFRMYDYGVDVNLQTYGRETPPNYNLTKIQVPVYVYTGFSDILCDPRDMALLKESLPNFRREFITDDPYFNHIDPMTGQNAADEMFSILLRDMQEDGQ